MHKESIDPDASLGVVHLTVSDLDRSLSYYQKSIGLNHHRTVNGTAHLGCGERDLLLLTEKRGARLAHRVSGLYHFALLLPSRLELGKTVRHLIDNSTHISGSADHAVSEAIYLSDPDGHGIELYRDRPRAEWVYEDGSLRINTEPFDADGVLGELRKGEISWAGLHPDTVMGHIHLHVGDLVTSEEFYVNVLGFDLIARYGSSASFVSAGGYHHHIGMNTWAGQGAPPPPQDALGLRYYSLRLPDPESLSRVTRRLQAAGVGITEGSEGLMINDPSENRVLLSL